jgi:murein DD-endopeptidase MepM/ murein hydrolase activator NlpD
MSYSYRSYQPHAETAPRHAYNQARAHPPSHQPQRPRGNNSRNAYTLTHAGHQVRIGPVAFWIVVGTLVIMGVWSIATGTYFAFRDNVLTRLISRQAEMQFAYEDRIAELRTQIDRITSHQLLDQEQFDQKLNALLKRQAVLEQHTSSLYNDAITTGSIKRGALKSSLQSALKLSPISATDAFVAPLSREASLDLRGRLSDQPVTHAATNGLDRTLSNVALSLDRVEQRQTTLLNAMEEEADSKKRHIHDVLAGIGVNLSRTPRVTATGGPFVPLRRPASTASAFDRQLYRIGIARAQVEGYKQIVNAVPVRKPVTGEIDLSSLFGVRTDPFLGRPAMHTGLDMRGDIGEPVRATANGRVSIAGREGGYGNMVEISHGNGLATRYGHLSEIDVKAGQSIHIGQVIGKIGSTGRSTGPHLHYETRINGEPVDPEKFLRAGVQLGRL